MDSSHVYRTKSLEYKTMKLMFCEGVFFAMFLFVLTTYLISEKAGDLYSSRRQQLDYWGGCTMQATSRHCKVNDVKDVHSLMTWLVDDFVPLAFTDRTEYPSVVKSPSPFPLMAAQDETPHWTPRYVGDTQTSVLIGTIRMRQVRVQYYKACSILDDLASIVTDCFADFSEAVQSTMSWAPAWTPQHLKDHYDWKSAFLTEQRPIVGRYATYPGDGFVMDLGLNLTGGQTRLQELQSWSWLDDRTRAFIIELNTINPNVNSFVHSRILFEFPAAGGVLIRQEAFPFRAVQLSLALMAADDFGGSFVYLVLTCGFSLLFAIYNIWLIYKNGARFFTYFWSNVDLLSLVVRLLRSLWCPVVFCTVVVYTAAITACARSSQWLQAEEVLAEMQRSIVRTNQFTYSAVISAFQRGAQWEEALSLLGQMARPNLVAFNAVLAACGANQWPLVLQILHKLRGRKLQADIVTYTTCIDACEGHWVWTLQLLDELERDRLQGNARTYSAAMKSCEHWPSALEFLEVMHRRQIQANLVVHNACLHACAKGAQWSLVLDQLEALPSRLLSADVVTYATAMHAAVRGSAWPHGLALFQKMSTWTVQGSVSTPVANTLLAACEQGSLWQEALEILRSQPALDVTGFSSVVSACCRAGLWRHGVHLLKRMRALQIPLSTGLFAAATNACAKRGQWEETLMWLHGSRCSALEPGLVATCASTGLAAAGRWLKAEELLQMMRNGQVQTDTMLCSSVMSKTQWQGCALSLEQLRQSGLEPDEVALNTLASAQCRGGRWRGALRTVAGSLSTVWGGGVVLEAAAALGAEDALLAAMQEVVEEWLPDWSRRCGSSLKFADDGRYVLALLHAATLARALRPRTCATVRSTLRMVGRALDGRDCAEDAPNPRGFAEKRFEAVQLAVGPSVRMRFSDGAVLYKPEGWGREKGLSRKSTQGFHLNVWWL
eukprot:g13969.t1